MRTVLIASTYFTSIASHGSIRMRALAKYLPRYGWRPVILTEEIPGEPALPRDQVSIVETFDPYAWVKRMLGLHAYQSVSSALEFGAMRSSQRNVVAHSLLNRSLNASLRVVQYLVIPDLHVGWYPFAIHAVKQIVHEKKFNVDAVLTSSNPKTPHLVGRQLKNITGAPWVADLRDFWTICHWYPYRGMRRYLERRLEVATLSKADALVTVSSPYAKRLGDFLGRKDVRAIPNGFDPDEWCEFPARLTEKYTITYTGSLGNGKRDPTPVFRALRELANDGIIDLNDVEVRFFGPLEPKIDKRASDLGLQNVVCQYGYVPRKEALERQRESQIILILFWNHPLEDGVYTSKLEYLAAGRPILATGGPGGVMDELLQETGAGVYAKTPEELRHFLANTYAEYKSKGAVLYRGQRERVFKYSHLEMVKQFAELLDELAEGAK